MMREHDAPAARQQRKMKLRTRIERKSGAPILRWRAKDLTPDQKYSDTTFSVVMDPAIEADSETYADVERQIVALGAKIIEKSSNQFQDSLVIKAPKDKAAAVSALEHVDLVVPRAKPKALITVDGVSDVALVPPGNSCSAAQTDKQAAIIDTLNGPKTGLQNRGGGVNVIVWDFIPPSSNMKGMAEFTDRPGGGAVVIRDEQGLEDWHGAAVASTCCGKYAGLATKATLIMLQLSDDITADLSVIDTICTNSSKPTIVNMSFALEYQSVNTAPDQAAVRDSIRALDDMLEDLKGRHNQLMFVVAGGNESLNPCDTTDPVSYGSGPNSCSNCYFWPQSRLGEPYDHTDVPFLLIGATEVFENAPHQRIASFSNFGACMHTFAHGEPVCAAYTDSGGFISTTGTSFSAPLFASLAAMRWSQRLSDSADDVTSYLISNAAATVDLSPEAVTANTNTNFSEVTSAMKTGGAEANPYDGGVGTLVGKDVVPVDDPVSSSVWIAVLGAVLAILIIGGYIYSRRRGS